MFRLKIWPIVIVPMILAMWSYSYSPALALLICLPMPFLLALVGDLEIKEFQNRGIDISEGIPSPFGNALAKILGVIFVAGVIWIIYIMIVNFPITGSP